jgi:transcription-repair coupling factor (superfamily II helicase)
VVIASPGHGTAERIAELLHTAKIPARVVEEIPEEIVSVEAQVTEVILIQAPIRKGFASTESKLILLTDSDFFGRGAGYNQAKRPKLAAKRGQAVDPLALKAGDYVVHEIHGIGRFVEMVQRQMGVGSSKHTREYLTIEYAPSKRGLAGDVLYVPTDQLDFLTRYVGGEAPVLSKMGGSDWSKVKGNARKAVRKIAIDLVKLYSARMNAKGYAFLPDTPWQREMEDSFPFVETPDQLNTVEEIKRDMERPVPMDRLVAGDVGYGKTEIAIRAAFKAVQDGKQVAVLVPTTLLVRQHVETFIERFAGFPVNVRALSRFQSAKESKETIAALATGEVDVVIGTHRLLSSGVKFRDLGLIIIDEEQRFGVEHKEKLKDMKTNVDVLSMSATPIPRTLEMAITGIREMSTLATPPEERHPILTYIGPYNERQVAAAIHRELIREGQVFFVHNRVDSIDKVASQLAELVPEARIAVAHGQMNEGQLEQVVIDFWERRYDVLVSTTIIEAGIDIPNANTLIVDRSENFGLSQLHQIRGRVGRSRERAYAYFLYSPDKPLSPFALDRLSTIAANNELGSGMQVAQKDLEIRGAGNLLGGEQSGHIAGVGFDLYLRMIGEAVDEFKGIKHESPAELKLEIPIDAHIPIEYVDSERLRLEAYHKLSAASGELGTRSQLDAIFQELEDRYGKSPQSVKNLIDVTELRQQCNRLNLKDVMMIGNQFRLTPVELTEARQIQLSHVYPGLRYLASAKQLSVSAPKDAQGEILEDRELIDWAWVFLAQVFNSQE